MTRPMNTEPITSVHLNSLGCRLGLPISGTFELTARCNFNCRMCYVHLKDNPEALIQRELTADKWVEIAREAKEMGLMFLLLTGGEPLIRADFPYLYEQLVKMGFVISINTNASLYNDKISELFRKYPPSRINVTLYGGSEETYSNLCGNASFERVVNNLKRMKAEGLQVRLNVSLTPYNISEIDKIDAISRELGLQAKGTAYMYPPVRVDGSVGENAARFSAEEAGAAIAKWYSLRDEKESFRKRAYSLMQGADFDDDTCADPEKNGVQCRAGRSAFWITWEGKMLPCGTMDIEGAYPAKSGFKQAWHEVKDKTSKIRLPIECVGCEHRKSCGVCASVCKGETGSFDKKPEYLCTMNISKMKNIFRIAGLTGEENEDKI